MKGSGPIAAIWPLSSLMQKRGKKQKGQSAIFAEGPVFAKKNQESRYSLDMFGRRNLALLILDVFTGAEKLVK